MDCIAAKRSNSERAMQRGAFEQYIGGSATALVLSGRGFQASAARPPANSRKSELADGAAIGNVTPEVAEAGVRHVKLSKTAQRGHSERHSRLSPPQLAQTYRGSGIAVTARSSHSRMASAEPCAPSSARAINTHRRGVRPTGPPSPSAVPLEEGELGG